MKKESTTSKTKNHVVLFRIWLVLTILALFSFTYYVLNYDEITIKLNNRNPAFEGRYDYYYYNNVTQACLFRCWNLYGSHHNATGNKRNCECTGGTVKFFLEVEGGVWKNLPEYFPAGKNGEPTGLEENNTHEVIVEVLEK